MFIFLILTMVNCRGGAKMEDVKNDTINASEINREIPLSDISQSITDQADSIMIGMTLEERIGQCFMVSMASIDHPVNQVLLKRYIADLHIGGVLLMQGDILSASSLAKTAEDANVPLFIAIDAEWGLGMRLKDAPVFPKNRELGKTADEDILYEYGREVGRECYEIGINMVLGPVVDVIGEGRGMIGSRSFGRDSHKVADLGVAYAKGLESYGIISVAKHFPGHGSTAVDSHVKKPVIYKSLQDIQNIDLYPFERYVEACLSGVMIGHLAFPAIDPSGLPAAVSPVIIRDLLRDEMNFNGLVLTDAFNMGGAKDTEPWQAILAGADIVVSPLSPEKSIKEVLGMVNSGEIPINTINESCRRILFYKLLVATDRKASWSGTNLLQVVNKDAHSLRELMIN